VGNFSNSIASIPQFVVSSLCVSALLVSSVYAVETKQDTVAACEEAAKLLQENEFDRALEEAEWCQRGIKQLKQVQTLSVIPDSVGGYAGKPAEQTAAADRLVG